MKYIKLAQDRVAIIDDEDFNYLNQWSWFIEKSRNTNYVVRANNKKKTIRMHRLIMGILDDRSVLVDHINHNGLDNRKSNLRICTNQENQFNKSKFKAKTSIYKGVSLDKTRSGKKIWRASICINRKVINLGNFESSKEASEKYNSKARSLFGEFAYLNI